RIVMSNSGVINAERGINRGRNVFRYDCSILRPAGGFNEAAVSCRRTDDPAGLNTAACKETRVDGIMIATLLARNISDSATKLAFRNDQCFIEFRSTVCAGHYGQVRDEVSKSGIELRGRSIDARTRLVNIGVIIPTAEGDHDVTRSQIRSHQIARHDA